MKKFTFYQPKNSDRNGGPYEAVEKVVAADEGHPERSRGISKMAQICDLVMVERFLGVIEDDKGRTIITPFDRYVQGAFCRVGRVMFCYEDKILISGYDGKPHMILPDLSPVNVEPRQVKSADLEYRNGEPGPARQGADAGNIVNPLVIKSL